LRITKSALETNRKKCIIAVALLKVDAVALLEGRNGNHLSIASEICRIFCGEK
jgi:hypothetical protein